MAWQVAAVRSGAISAYAGCAAAPLLLIGGPSCAWWPVVYLPYPPGQDLRWWWWQSVHCSAAGLFPALREGFQGILCDGCAFSSQWKNHPPDQVCRQGSVHTWRSCGCGTRSALWKMSLLAGDCRSFVRQSTQGGSQPTCAEARRDLRHRRWRLGLTTSR